MGWFSDLSAPGEYLRHQLSRAKAMRSALRCAKREYRTYFGVIAQLLGTFRDGGVRGLKQRILIWAAADALPPRNEASRNNYAEWIRRFDTLDHATRKRIKARIRQQQPTPLISIVMHVCDPPIRMLDDAIRSVRRQLYPHWELCINDATSTNTAVRRLIRKHAQKDQRIKRTAEISRGEFTALLDECDTLAEDALFRVADAIAAHPNVALIYSDEDTIDQSTKRSDPYFKCDWNPDLLLSQNFIGDLAVYRIDLVKTPNGHQHAFEGASAYDLALRCTEQIAPEQIVHIPKVLYHRRSGAREQNGQSFDGERALNLHFDRIGVRANAERIGTDTYRVHYAISQPEPFVSVIIPTRNGLHLIRQCVESILEKTIHQAYEMLIVDNNSDDAETLTYLHDLATRDRRVRVLRDARPFNFSQLNNAAVLQARGEYLALVNNDVEVISPTWLGEMLSLAQQPGVGVVGARLWYPNDTLQHGGILLGVFGAAGHFHKHLPKGQPGYSGRAQLTQTVSAVTAACCLVEKRIYQEVGGLDEVNLKVDYNDVDFCLRVKEAGYRNIWTPYAELYHHESATRGGDDTAEGKARVISETQYLQRRWQQILLNDPAYNPNLSLEHEDLSLAWPPRVQH
jgi:GT2 family glycosyltransferase